MEWLLGLLFWVLLFYPAWSPRCRRIRRQRGDARPSIAIPIRVSRNKVAQETGPKWEQDSPFPECFDQMEDDL